MKRREPQRVGEIIAKAIAETGNERIFNEQRLCYLWPEVVGPAINRYTTRRWVDHGTLHVCLSSSSLKNELSFHRTVLVERLNGAIGKKIIDSIIIH